MAARPLSLSFSDSRAWRKYNISLRSSPIATKSVTCMAAYIIGDLSAQVSTSRTRRLDEKLAAVDLARTARMALYGLLWCGPAGHGFYRWLDKSWMPGNPTAVAAVAGKVGIDQLLFAPLSTAVFFAWANLAAATPERIPGDLQDKFCPSVRAAWALWVPAMTINMALVPPAMRILWINAMAIVWTNILSNMAAAPEPATLPEPLDLERLAANICSEEEQRAASPRTRGSPRSTKELRSTPRSEPGGRSPRTTKERQAAAPVRRTADAGGSSSVRSPRETADDSDSTLAWLLGMVRHEDEGHDRRSSIAASAHERETLVNDDDELPESSSHVINRLEAWPLADSCPDAGEFAAAAEAAVEPELDGFFDAAAAPAVAVA